MHNARRVIKEINRRTLGIRYGIRGNSRILKPICGAARSDSFGFSSGTTERFRSSNNVQENP